MKAILLPLIAFAPVLGCAQTTSGDWAYTLNSSNEATIVGYYGAGGNVAVPATLDGFPVKKIGGEINWPLGAQFVFGDAYNSVTSITFSSPVTFGQGAFANLRALTNLSLPEGLTDIPAYAFCFNALKSISIPSGVTNIGAYAFSYCYSLTNTILAEGLTSVGDHAYFGTAISSIHIPSTVTNLGFGAFDASALGLISVAIGNAYFSSSSDVLFNKNQTTLIRYPPRRAGNSYTIPNTVTTIAAYAFSEAGLTAVSIPSSVTSLSDGAFNGCFELTNVVIPTGITHIPNYAFAGCQQLRNVSFPSNLVAVGRGAFFNSQQLDTVILPLGCGLSGDSFHQTTQVRWNTSALATNSPFVATLATNEAFITALAEKITSSIPANYGIATKSDLATSVSNAISQTVVQVQSNPNQYSLYSAQQYAENYNNGIATGTSLVTENPSSYNLYTSNSIADLRMGGLMVQKQGSNAVVSFQPQTTTDLATQPFTNNGTPILHEIPMPSNKGFIRIQAIPNPTPVPNL